MPNDPLTFGEMIVPLENITDCPEQLTGISDVTRKIIMEAGLVELDALSQATESNAFQEIIKEYWSDK